MVTPIEYRKPLAKRTGVFFFALWCVGLLRYYSGSKEILGVVFKRRPKDMIWCATFVIKISKGFRLEGFSHMNGRRYWGEGKLSLRQ